MSNPTHKTTQTSEIHPENSDNSSNRTPPGGLNSPNPVIPHNDPDAAIVYRRIDPSSPYYLGSSDQPGLIICLVQLTAANYDEWSRSMKLSLQGRRKYGFIDGTTTKPMNPEFLGDWVAVQSTLVQWTLNTINTNQRKSFPHFEEAKPLWDMLYRRYTVTNGQHKQDLKHELSECKQTPTMTVADYFGKLEKLWDELAACTPVPACTCGVGEQFQQRIDDEKFHDFLCGLDATRLGNLRIIIIYK